MVKNLQFLKLYFNKWTNAIRRQWHPTPVFLPGESQGRGRLVGCSPWGREESDRTERLHFHLSLSRIGEGDGTPLQCSCLENPRDGGAWRAAVRGVAQSRARLGDSAAAAGQSPPGKCSLNPPQCGRLLQFLELYCCKNEATSS